MKDKVVKVAVMAGSQLVKVITKWIVEYTSSEEFKKMVKDMLESVAQKVATIVISEKSTEK